MKDPPRSAHAFAPPLKIVRAHGAPAIERNTPVLSPFLRKCVVLEVWLGRSATEPVEHEFIRARENVGAVITDTERDVAHQSDAALLGVRFNVPPLLERNPLHVTKEIQTAPRGCLLRLRQITQPTARTFDRPMLRRPLIPRGAAFILLDEKAEQRVIAQPRGFFFAEAFEF